MCAALIVFPLVFALGSSMQMDEILRFEQRRAIVNLEKQAAREAEERVRDQVRQLEYAQRQIAFANAQAAEASRKAMEKANIQQENAKRITRLKKACKAIEDASAEKKAHLRELQQAIQVLESLVQEIRFYDSDTQKITKQIDDLLTSFLA